MNALSKLIPLRFSLIQQPRSARPSNAVVWTLFALALVLGVATGSQSGRSSARAQIAPPATPDWYLATEDFWRSGWGSTVGPGKVSWDMTPVSGTLDLEYLDPVAGHLVLPGSFVENARVALPSAAATQVITEEIGIAGDPPLEIRVTIDRVAVAGTFSGAGGYQTHLMGELLHTTAGLYDARGMLVDDGAGMPMEVDTRTFAIALASATSDGMADALALYVANLFNDDEPCDVTTAPDSLKQNWCASAPNKDLCTQCVMDKFCGLLNALRQYADKIKSLETLKDLGEALTKCRAEGKSAKTCLKDAVLGLVDVDGALKELIRVTAGMLVCSRGQVVTLCVTATPGDVVPTVPPTSPGIVPGPGTPPPPPNIIPTIWGEGGHLTAQTSVLVRKGETGGGASSMAASAVQVDSTDPSSFDALLVLPNGAADPSSARAFVESRRRQIFSLADQSAPWAVPVRARHVENGPWSDIRLSIAAGTVETSPGSAVPVVALIATLVPDNPTAAILETGSIAKVADSLQSALSEVDAYADLFTQGSSSSPGNLAASVAHLQPHSFVPMAGTEPYPVDPGDVSYDYNQCMADALLTILFRSLELADKVGENAEKCQVLIEPPAIALCIGILTVFDRDSREAVELWLDALAAAVNDFPECRRTSTPRVCPTFTYPTPVPVTPLPPMPTPTAVVTAVPTPFPPSADGCESTIPDFCTGLGLGWKAMCDDESEVENCFGLCNLKNSPSDCPIFRQADPPYGMGGYCASLGCACQQSENPDASRAACSRLHAMCALSNPTRALNPMCGVLDRTCTAFPGLKICTGFPWP